MRSTSVLFTEFSKKSLREVVDRLAPMIGFNKNPRVDAQAREVLKEILCEVAECGAAFVSALPPERRHQVQPRKGGIRQSTKDSIPSWDCSKAANSRLLDCAYSPGKPAETLTGHEERKIRLRLERQESMQKDLQWRREGLRLGGAVSGWLEQELQLQLFLAVCKQCPQPSSIVCMPCPHPNCICTV
jgi:hypothetical protein